MKSSKFSRLISKSDNKTLNGADRVSLTTPYLYAGYQTVPACSFLLPLSEILIAGTVQSGKQDSISGMGEALPRFSHRFCQSASSRLHPSNETMPSVRSRQTTFV